MRPTAFCGGYPGPQAGIASRTRNREDGVPPCCRKTHEDMSEREDLVLAYRILAAHGVVDAYGHVSLRTAKDPKRYLLARAMAPELVTNDDIVEFDLDSAPIKDPGVALYL